MRGKKVYGQSKSEECIFCGKQAMTKNSQGLPCCDKDKDEVLPDKRCVCGEYLDIKESKWGAFFVCNKCGPISLKKGLNMEASGFKLNKKYREHTEPTKSTKKPPVEYDKRRIYTIEELEQLWD